MPYYNLTSTATFLSCTPPAMTRTLPPAVYTTLAPVTQTMYTTVYETVLPAACETSQWMATYTVTETCAGNPADYVTSKIPPGFVVTTVSCAACQPTEIEITCPGAQPTGAGMQYVSVTGNGVTATVTASPVGYPGMGYPGAQTGTAVTPVATGGYESSGSCSESGSCSGSYPGSNPGSGSCSGAGCPGSNTGSSDSNSCSGGSCSSSGYGTGSNAGSSNGSSPSCSSGSCSGSYPAGGNGTYTTPPIATGGAPSLKHAFALFSGLALVAGHFFLL
ncbi:hypothetical protein F5Y04DRAFT_107567 [Hypomontagnella monticulosa]|nr:hypothetical protein F5Y04DRAFT_107567 [Hypomontagnella monticulosa]